MSIDGVEPDVWTWNRNEGRGEENEGAVPETVDSYRSLVERLRGQGQALKAVDMAEQGLARWPDDIRLTQLKALSLADSGASARAGAIMGRLFRAGHRDVETMGILARTHKDMWASEQDPSLRRSHLQRARDCYEQCFRETGDYYPGINAATLALLLGEEDRSHDMARKVERIVRDRLGETGPDYYLLATLAEAELLLGSTGRAMESYAAAGRLGRESKQYRALYSTRRNGELILRSLSPGMADDLGGVLAGALVVPKVVVFTGHMTDGPGRPVPRFPDGMPELEEELARKLGERLTELDGGFVYCSAARGSDIILLEEAGRMGLERHVVLPYNKEQFVADSVDREGDQGRWRARFLRVMDEVAEHVTYASDWPIGKGGDSYDYANRILLGLACLRAERLGTGVSPLAVWDGREGDGAGGTGSTVAWWRGMGYSPAVVDLAGLVGAFGGPVGTREDGGGSVSGEPAGDATNGGQPGNEAQLRAMLFADVVQYSRLREEHIPLFMEHFIGGIAAMAERAGMEPEVKNTWGDAFYFVFDGVERAGRFALAMVDFVHGTDWSSLGLPAGLDIRVGLHAGPVYHCLDPVLKQLTYTGTHVSRAARIEPITRRGQVFASAAFAALAAVERGGHFLCEYVGRTPFAKDYGTFPVFNLRPASGRAQEG